MLLFPRLRANARVAAASAPRVGLAQLEDAARTLPAMAQPEPRDPIEDDIAEALADPEFLASLEGDEAAEDREEPLESIVGEDAEAFFAELRRRDDEHGVRGRRHRLPGRVRLADRRQQLVASFLARAALMVVGAMVALTIVRPERRLDVRPIQVTAPT